MFQANCSPVTCTTSASFAGGWASTRAAHSGMAKPIRRTASTTATPISRYVDRCDVTPL